MKAMNLLSLLSRRPRLIRPPRTSNCRSEDLSCVSTMLRDTEVHFRFSKVKGSTFLGHRKPAPAEKGSILVVDDNQINQMVLLRPRLNLVSTYPHFTHVFVFLVIDKNAPAIFCGR